MNRKRIDIGDIWDGDVIAVSALEHIDNDFSSRKWHDHFATCKRFYFVKKAGNNFVTAVDYRGHYRTFGYNEIEEAYRLERRTA